MAVSLSISLRREINQVERDINRRTSELASLKTQLSKLQGVQSLLEGNRARGRGKPRPARRKARTARRRTRVIDWNSVLKALPATFSLDNLAKNSAVIRKPRAYLRQMLSRWVKARKVKRTGRGEYQKA